MYEFEPCPFCGSNKIKIHECDSLGSILCPNHADYYFDASRDYYLVMCSKCCAKTKQYKTKNGAVKRWNSRY